MSRLIGIVLLLLLGLRLLTALAPFFSPSLRQTFERWRVTVDVAGGFVMLLLIGIQVAYREWRGAVLLVLLGLPVFVGMYKALPAWWYGTGEQQQNPKTKNKQ